MTPLARCHKKGVLLPRLNELLVSPNMKSEIWRRRIRRLNVIAMETDMSQEDYQKQRDIIFAHNDIRKAARSLKKVLNMSSCHCYETIARNRGYKSYNAFLAANPLHKCLRGIK